MGSSRTRMGRRLSVDLRRGRGVAGYVRICLLSVVAYASMAVMGLPALAQNANQPGYDPRQIEKRFEDQQSSQGGNGRPRLPSAQFAGAEGKGDAKPLFVLRRVAIEGAVAIPQERLATA